MRPLWYGWDYQWHVLPTQFVDYSKSPGWWNRFYNNRPKRKAANRLCRQIANGTVEADLAMFPLNRKPYYYFW